MNSVYKTELCSKLESIIAAYRNVADAHRELFALEGTALPCRFFAKLYRYIDEPFTPMQEEYYGKWRKITDRAKGIRLEVKAIVDEYSSKMGIQECDEVFAMLVAKHFPKINAAGFCWNAFLEGLNGMNEETCMMEFEFASRGMIEENAFYDGR